MIVYSCAPQYCFIYYCYFVVSAQAQLIFLSQVGDDQFYSYSTVHVSAPRTTGESGTVLRERGTVPWHSTLGTFGAVHGAVPWDSTLVTWAQSPWHNSSQSIFRICRDRKSHENATRRNQPSKGSIEPAARRSAYAQTKIPAGPRAQTHVTGGAKSAPEHATTRCTLAAIVSIEKATAVRSCDRRSTLATSGQS